MEDVFKTHPPIEKELANTKKSYCEPCTDDKYWASPLSIKQKRNCTWCLRCSAIREVYHNKKPRQ